MNEPDCHVTYDVRADLLTLYVPDFNLRRAIWMGPTLTVDEALRKYVYARQANRLVFRCKSADIRSSGTM